MKQIRTLLLAAGIFGVCSALLSGCSDGSTANVSACNERLRVLFSQDWTGREEALLTEVRAFEPACDASADYALAHSTALLLTGQIDQAEAIARSALQLPNADVEGLFHVVYNAARKKDLSAAELVVEELERLRPQSAMALLLRARYSNATGKYASAANAARSALALGAGREAVTVLVTALYNSNQFEQSFAVFQERARADRRLYSDLDAVLAASGSLASLGRMEEARALIDEHLAIVPGSRSQPLVQRLLTLTSGT